MKTIQLTKGYKTLVDDKDYDYLNSFKWCADVRRTTVYALRGQWVPKIKKYKTIRMHREIIKTNKQVDRINGNGLDNRRANLRECAPAQNSRNQQRRKSNISGFKGVHKHGKNWAAQIKIKHKTLHLGTYSTKEKAASVYNRAAKKYFKEFAKLNVLRLK